MESYCYCNFNARVNTVKIFQLYVLSLAALNAEQGLFAVWNFLQIIFKTATRQNERPPLTEFA